MIAAAWLCMNMSWGTGLALAQEPGAQESVAVPPPVSAPPAATSTATGPAAVPYAAPPVAPQVEPPRRRFVHGFLPSLTMGISPLPSANLAVFLGARLKRGPWALGYQFTFSSGGAERYSVGWTTHRHHLTAMRGFGRSGRGFASVGGGGAFLWLSPVVEVEGRVGLRFGSKQYGVLAAQVRLGWDIGHRELAPMPQFGVVLGFAVM